MADEAAWASIVDDTVERFGSLDVLVNNAGVGSEADAEHETVQTWERVIAINQKGVWLGMRAAIPAMRAAGGGSIINVSSIFGAVGGFGVAGPGASYMTGSEIYVDGGWTAR